MKIFGEKFLNENNYNAILIDLKDREFKVKVTGNPQVDSKVNNNFMKSLEELNDNNKIVSITNYFLENSSLVEVARGGMLKNQFLSKDYTIARSKSGNVLILKLNSSKLSNNLIKLVDLKYSKDRYNYYLENKLSSIYLSNQDVKKYNEDALYLRADKKCGKLYLENVERKDLTEILNSKFDNLNKASIGEFIPNHYTNRLVCGDLNVNVQNIETLVDAVRDIVNKYNDKLDNKEIEKGFQLKLKK